MALVDLLYGAPSQSAIGTITLDALLSEQIELPSTATEYPVENGSTITDDIIPQSRRLRINGTISSGSMMMFNASAGGPPSGKGKLQDAKAALEAIWGMRTPITIVTGLDIYSDFAMTRCDLTRSGEGAAAFLDIRSEFVEIRTVSTQTTTVAADPPTQKKAAPTKKVGQVTGKSQTDNSLYGKDTPKSIGANAWDHGKKLLQQYLGGGGSGIGGGTTSAVSSTVST